MKKLRQAAPILEYLKEILEENTDTVESPEFVTDDVEDPVWTVPKLVCQIGDKANGWGVKPVEGWVLANPNFPFKKNCGLFSPKREIWNFSTNSFLLNSTVVGLMSVLFLVAIEFMNLEASSLSQIFTRQCHRLTVILGFVRQSPQPSESVCGKCTACKKHVLDHQSS